MFGQSYSDTAAGRTFSQTGSPLGLAIPIYTATAVAGGMPIWNTPTSNRLVELVSVEINWASGTADFAAIVLMGILNLQAVITGALCTAFGNTVPVAGRLGSGGTQIQSSNGGTVTVTAGVATAPTATAPGVLRSLGSFNLEANSGTAHGTTGFSYQFNGTLLLPPGNMIYLAATKASVALYCSTFTWKEYPINPQQG